jgi:hypothetical protein
MQAMISDLLACINLFGGWHILPICRLHDIFFFAAGLKPGCALSAHVESAPLHLASRKLDRSSNANDT